MFDENEEDPIIDLTPLIDVIFMLVIFFVMTMTFSKPVLDVILPSAENSVVQKKSKELEIVIHQDGSIWYGDKTLLHDQISPLLDEHSDELLNLIVDEKAPFDAFISVVDIAKVKRDGKFLITTKRKAKEK